MKVKAVRGIANPLGTIDSHGTVIESIANAGDGVDILNRHREKIGSGFVHLEGDNVILTGYVGKIPPLTMALIIFSHQAWQCLMRDRNVGRLKPGCL